MSFVFVFLLVAIAAAAIFVPQTHPLLGGLEPGEVAYLAVYGAIGVSLAAAILARYQGRLGAALRDMAIWCVLALGALSAYAYRDALRPIADRIRAEIVPGTVLVPNPGQALAYMIGRREIERLRSYASAELGDAFDVRSFHATVLGNGAVPLDVLELLVRNWVAREAAAVR